jgi:hypothetical protein
VTSSTASPSIASATSARSVGSSCPTARGRTRSSARAGIPPEGVDPLRVAPWRTGRPPTRNWPD